MSLLEAFSFIHYSFKTFIVIVTSSVGNAMNLIYPPIFENKVL